MIRHIVLFKLKAGYSWEQPEVRAAEELQARMGEQIGELRDWKYGRNISTRPLAYDYAVHGLLDDHDALARYLTHPFHQQAAAAWTRISDRVVADVWEAPSRRTTEGEPSVRTG